MRITRTGKPDNFYYYIIEDYRDTNGKKRSRTVESLGCARVIREKYSVDDAEAWCKAYVEQKNIEATKKKLETSREITVKLNESAPKSNSKSSIYNAGYLVLDSLYHTFGIENICSEIQVEHPHITGFTLNNVLRTMLFGRILFPSSKLSLTEKQSRLLENNNIELQHIYRTMDILAENKTLIQNRLYQYSSQSCNRDVNRIYYDCTNFFTEKELEDCDRTDKSDEWKNEHTLRKYGKSKENRPNPIVQMGLFMDGNGLPLGLCINSGNTNEQVTMVPLEKEIVSLIGKKDIIVCTDAGLSSVSNREFNNITEDNEFVKNGICGKRNYICTKSIKKLPKHLIDWALNSEGWSYSYFDKTQNRRITVNGFDLKDFEDNEKLCEKHYNTTFFKERTISENGLDERLIVTFSIKYKIYMENLRARKINRALKMIANGSTEHESETSPRALLTRDFCTEDGEIATKMSVHLNQNKIDEASKFDGFYAVSTNIFRDEMDVQQIAAIGGRRWEIEECFRIMKTDLRSRPFYHSKDNRIIAHFMTCFIALLLVRGVELKLSEYHGKHDKYPNGKYTVTEILDALKNINVIDIDNRGYKPDYTDSELISDLLNVFNLKEFSKQVIMPDTMKKIIRSVKKSPNMITKKKTRKK